MKFQEIMSKSTEKLFLVIICCIACFFSSCNSCSSDIPKEDEYGESCLLEYGICVDSLDVTQFQVKSGESLSVIFSNLGFSAAQTDKIVKASTDILNPKRIVAGANY